MIDFNTFFGAATSFGTYSACCQAVTKSQGALSPKPGLTCRQKITHSTSSQSSHPSLSPAPPSSPGPSPSLSSPPPPIPAGGNGGFLAFSLVSMESRSSNYSSDWCLMKFILYFTVPTFTTAAAKAVISTTAPVPLRF